MTRTNIDIDDVLCDAVMRRFNCSTKKDAVNLALRLLVAQPMTDDRVRGMRGSGWAGDLDDLRRPR
jgi:Arc/MetJ family transcription regulator